MVSNDGSGRTLVFADGIDATFGRLDELSGLLVAALAEVVEIAPARTRIRRDRQRRVDIHLSTAVRGVGRFTLRRPVTRPETGSEQAGGDTRQQASIVSEYR